MLRSLAAWLNVNRILILNVRDVLFGFFFWKKNEERKKLLFITYFTQFQQIIAILAAHLILLYAFYHFIKLSCVRRTLEAAVIAAAMLLNQQAKLTAISL